MLSKILKTTGLLLISAILVLISVFLFNMRDRNRGYDAGMTIKNTEQRPLKAGFASVKITPEVPDRWVDVNGDASFNLKDGDTYDDLNGNGRFDPVWIAGFGNARAANGIHDDLWARTLVIDDGATRIAIVALDAIGFMNNHVIEVRNLIPADAGITYTIISSLHDHEAPDLIGMWGSSAFKNGVDTKYLESVKKNIAASVVAAVNDLSPVILEVSQDLTGVAHMVKDTRDPQVTDSGLRIIKAVDKASHKTKGVLVAWADHPETLWGKNLLITSDFPHYAREGIEKGIYYGDSLMKAGAGGTAVYINGSLGGLMTTHPSLPVRCPFSGVEYSEPTFEKAEAQGKQLALAALKAMENPVEVIDSGGISLISRTIRIPVKNKLFRLAVALGVFDRGMAGWMKMRTEISAFTLGPISFVTVPGEIYPEIINGGVEVPQGSDFPVTDIIEGTAVRDLMPGKYKFVFGLANDEIGYIIPKSQWDEKPPYTYGRKDSPYGEENSLGPETAPVLYTNLKEILSELNNR